MYYIYLLRCKDNSLYCGQTNNLEKRIEEHNFSKTKAAKYTRGRKPVVLVYVEQVKTISIALQREYEIKKLTKKQKESLILSFQEMKKMISTKGKKNRPN